jgi:hypothetical protein
VLSLSKHASTDRAVLISALRLAQGYGKFRRQTK